MTAENSDALAATVSLADELAGKGAGDGAAGGVTMGEGEWLAILCLRCGEEGPGSTSAVDAEGVSYFCPACRADMDAEPVILPGYKVIKRLGQGSMGVVDLASHETLGLRVLKRMLPRVALSERNRQMFLREASKQAQVKHPNVVELFGFHEQPPGVFVAVLEYVDGENADRLRQRKAGKRLAPALAVSLVEQALRGLAFMHDKGIVHRDIKEENLMVQLDPGGGIATVKITDFGLAKSYNELDYSGLTVTGEAAGTLPYMPPEQISDYRSVKPPADLYAMGASLYRLLSGDFPHDFAGRHPLSVILAERPVPLRERVPTVPEGLARCVEIAMAHDPEQRFSSAQAMREALLALDL